MAFIELLVVKALFEVVRAGGKGVVRAGNWFKRNFDGPGMRTDILNRLFIPSPRAQPSAGSSVAVTASFFQPGTRAVAVERSG